MLRDLDNKLKEAIFGRYAGQIRVSLLFLCMVFFVATTSVPGDDDVEVDYGEKSDVYIPKLWFLKEFDVYGFHVPVSPLSILVIAVVSINFVLNWGTYAWCEASHILIKAHGPEAKLAMSELRDEIGSDYKKFAEMAKKHSDCPSGRQGGSLGRFYRGDMAKNFDRACFDPKQPTGTTIGPLETSFGWHLIFIQKRSI